jgi:tetratricopeptide (TPR) repeat protein
MGKEPDDYKPYGGREQVLVELSRFDEAVRDLNHALKLVHRSSEEFSYRVQLQAFTHNGKTATLAGLGQNDLAVKEFKDSINLQPDNAWVYFNRVQFHERNNDIAAAAAAYRVALDKEKPPLSLLKRVLPKSD